jgi:dTDP-4-amino-4,6-dideoxygalactose transaminase
MNNAFIPFARPDIDSREIQAVTDVLNSGWITSGAVMREFETNFLSYIGADVTALAVNSATSGLHLALEAIGVGPGDEVIVPDWTFTSTAEVVRYLGANPVIVDVDRATLNMDLEKALASVTSRTKAIIPVHFAGLPLDLEKLRTSLPSSIFIIEDAAHSFPATVKQKLIGSCQFSDICVFSFYATKTITTGEGGMITTRRKSLADRMQIMRLHGIDRDAFDRYNSKTPAWKYNVVAPGFKYNMTDMAAAIGIVQLRKAEVMRSRREQIAQRYLVSFGDLPIGLPINIDAGDIHAWHLFVIRLATSKRDHFIQQLLNEGISSSVHFIPLHRHSYWAEFVSPNIANLQVSEEEADSVVSLPIYSSMTDDEVTRVIESVREYFDK